MDSVSVPSWVIPDELLELASPQELEAYKKLLEKEVALRSPLDFAQYVSKGTMRYRHIEILNEEIVALLEYRLYEDGPGPSANWFYKLASGEVIEVESVWDIPLDDLQVAEQIVDWWGEHPDRPGHRVIFCLGVVMPPRHGKSYLVTEHVAPWVISRWPHYQVALCTYSDDFAFEWGSKAMDLLSGERSLVSVSGNRQLITVNGTRGCIRYAGVGGRLTGSGYHVGIIDDPYKNAQEALSPADRKTKDDWYGSVYSTRKEPRAVEILMYTRWHEEDLAGTRVYGEDGVRPGWRVVHMSALYDPDIVEVDPLGREPGEALCRPRFNEANLAKIRAEDPVWFAALYQGAPTALTGTILGGNFRDFELYGAGWGILPVIGEEYDADALLEGKYLCTLQARDAKRFVTVDLAASLKSWADWSVCGCWEWYPVEGYLLLFEVVRTKLETTDHVDWIKGVADGFGTKHIGIEHKTFGINALNSLKQDSGYTLYKLEAETDKVTRALDFGRLMKQGKVALPRSAPWRYDYQKEVAKFPKAKHDDQVDVSANAALMVRMYPELGDSSEQRPLTPEERCAALIDKMSKSRRAGLRTLINVGMS